MTLSILTVGMHSLLVASLDNLTEGAANSLANHNKLTGQKWSLLDNEATT